MTYRPQNDPSRTYDDFRSLVKSWVEHHDTARKELAREFEVSQGTVDRWWMDLASPHPSLQAQVTSYIKARL